MYNVYTADGAMTSYTFLYRPPTVYYYIILYNTQMMDMAVLSCDYLCYACVWVVFLRLNWREMWTWNRKQQQNIHMHIFNMLFVFIIWSPARVLHINIILEPCKVVIKNSYNFNQVKHGLQIFLLQFNHQSTSTFVHNLTLE